MGQRAPLQTRACKDACKLQIHPQAEKNAVNRLRQEEDQVYQAAGFLDQGGGKEASKVVRGGDRGVLRHFNSKSLAWLSLPKSRQKETAQAIQK